MGTAPRRSSEPAKPADFRQVVRQTATFVPYYWEAYNEIVEPRRFDHYLVRRWLPSLGPLGFAIVKTLRDRCYHNPSTGVLRNEVEIDVDDIAAAVGVGRSTVFREFTRNEALAQFVRRVQQFRMVGGRPQQAKNLYQVCMDDPIHPDDMERYDELRTQKEIDRRTGDVAGNGAQPKKRLRPEGRGDRSSALESQNGTQRDSASTGLESQSDTQKQSGSGTESQIGTADTSYLAVQSATPDTSCPGAQGATTISEDLPSGSLFTSLLTPSAGAPQYAPQRGEDPDDVAATVAGSMATAEEARVRRVWEEALECLAAVVSKPTLEAHMRPLQPRGMNEVTGTFDLVCVSAFNREWLEKRHGAHIAAAVGESLGEPVQIRFLTAEKSETAIRVPGRTG